MEVLTDADGWILIGTLLTPVDQSLMVSWTDRNGKHFGAILNYLRDGTIPLPETHIGHVPEFSNLGSKSRKGPM